MFGKLFLRLIDVASLSASYIAHRSVKISNPVSQLVVHNLVNNSVELLIGCWLTLSVFLSLRRSRGSLCHNALFSAQHRFSDTNTSTLVLPPSISHKRLEAFEMNRSNLTQTEKIKKRAGQIAKLHDKGEGRQVTTSLASCHISERYLDLLKS